MNNRELAFNLIESSDKEFRADVTFSEDGGGIGIANLIIRDNGKVTEYEKSISYSQFEQLLKISGLYPSGVVLTSVSGVGNVAKKIISRFKSF